MRKCDLSETHLPCLCLCAIEDVVDVVIDILLGPHVQLAFVLNLVLAAASVDLGGRTLLHGAQKTARRYI